ncbi:MAG: neutral/alkaline non-lysosomal ceramidase N-terminal domain-containing protein [Anaerolineae bacterium]
MSTSSSTSTESGQLLVGAAKVDITTPEDALPWGYNAIHDHVYARAIVLGNGNTKAVLLGADLGMFTEDSYDELCRRITEEVGCPRENILMTGTHTHGSPSPGAVPLPGRSTNVLDSFDVSYATWIKQHVLESVRQANASPQPARVGYGTGAFYANVNRDAIHPETRTWYQGPNPDGPSDKTVAVVKFESISGEPIAVYINYAMHANLMFMRNEISGGFPGATSRYIEEVYNDQAVAIWTAGAAGDQNPLYMRLAEPAIAAQKRPQFAAAGGDPTNVFALANYQDAKLDPKALRLGARLVDSIGQLLGEEVIRVMGNMTRTSSRVRIWGAHQTVTCPGRRRLDRGREGAPGTYEDAEPVDIRLGLLVVDQIALVAVTGELYNIIAQRLKKVAPYGHTVVVTIANGKSVGYIPDDAAYGRHTFQVLGCRIKKGCAEQGIINTALDMMDESLSC